MLTFLLRDFAIDAIKIKCTLEVFYIVYAQSLFTLITQNSLTSKCLSRYDPYVVATYTVSY